ncbi:hypothetical protein ACFL6S_22065 [Candidatus Poribacteria bacterium]
MIPQARCMYLRSVVLPAIILLFLCAAAHPDIRFSGSAYSETSFIDSDGTIRYGNRTDLHLKSVSSSQGAKLVSELEIYTLYGYLAGTNEIISYFLEDGLFYIDRLYLKFPISRADMILGKQRIAWGSSVIYRPTDTFNRPNPLSLSGRKEGVNAIVAKLSVGDLSAIDFVIAPADVFKRINGEVNLEHLKYGKFASRFTFNKFKADMALSYQYDGTPEDNIFGLDIKGDLGLGYHLETVFTYNRGKFDVDDIEKYWQSVLGFDYSFGGKWILLGEYLYNGPGRSQKADLSASEFALLDEFQYRHYLFPQISYLYDIFLRANVFMLWNAVDGSFVLSPGIQYSLFQNTDLNIYSLIFFGDETDEYGPERMGVDQVYYLKLTVKF